jgi:transposase
LTIADLRYVVGGNAAGKTPKMRVVPTKTPEQQASLVLHRTRRLFIRQQIAIINSIRSHLAEFGIGGRVGRHGVQELIADSDDARVPVAARACIAALGVQSLQLRAQILELKRWEGQARRRPHRKRHTLQKVVH